jgi:hypothetical protein
MAAALTHCPGCGMRLDMDPLAVGHYTIAIERAEKLGNEYVKTMTELSVLIGQSKSRGGLVNFDPGRARALLEQAARLSGQVVETVVEANGYAEAAEKPRLSTPKVG